MLTRDGADRCRRRSRSPSSRRPTSRRPSATATRDAHSVSRAALRLPLAARQAHRGQAHTAWSTAHRVVKQTSTPRSRQPRDRQPRQYVNIATAALAFAASLNESELMLCGLARWRSTCDEVYDRIVVPNSSRPHAAPCILKGRAAELPHLYLAFDAHTLEKICENTPNLNSTSCPTFDSAHLD